MKRIILFFLLSIFIADFNFSQIIYNSKIDSLKNLVSLQSIVKFAKELSGDTITFIGGSPFLIYSRFYSSPSNSKAAQYIFERFQEYGLNSKYQIIDSTCVNVIGIKPGTKYPNRYFIICAHYDDIIIPLPSSTDTVPGADDNASGICAILESARLLGNFNPIYSLIFIAFDQEEINGKGSLGFVDSIYSRSDTVMGVLNLDMIGWDVNNDNKAVFLTDNNSLILTEQIINVIQLYFTGIPYYYNPELPFAGDHTAFWRYKYRAICLIEDVYNEFNPNYHKISDRVNTFNFNYFHKMVKIGISLFSSWASGNFARMDHIPIISSSDTINKTAEVMIMHPQLRETGQYAPRLYYKIWNSTYNFVNASSINQNIYKFIIPAQPKGTKISYYIAAQDSTGNFVFTLPQGGSGINPPGTTPPPIVYSYYIWNSMTIHSNSTPKPIEIGFTNDTINITIQGVIIDVNTTLNINHTNDGDLLLNLGKTSSNSSNLSQYNGIGGQNFTNTIFDDSASISITQGIPPFTGRFRPQTPLSVFNNKELFGNWILRIYDKGNGNLGTLLNWCLEIIYAPTVNVKEISDANIEKYALSQNYPNPFNPITNIKYQIPKTRLVTLRIYDIIGREIKTLVNEVKNPGSYQVTFKGSEFPSGVYFYRIQSGDFVQVKKMILLK